MKFLNLNKKFGVIALMGIVLIVSIIAFVNYGSTYDEIYKVENKAKYDFYRNDAAHGEVYDEESAKIVAAEEAKIIAEKEAWRTIGGTGYSLSFFFILIAGLGAIALPIAIQLKTPRVFIKTGIGVISLLILFAISWAMADTTVTTDVQISDSVSRLSGALINLAIITILLAVIGIIASSIRTAIKG